MSIKILLVDDSPYFLEAASYFLNLQEALEVVDTASDGDEALVKAQRADLDVILLDINLPGRSGFELIPHFRQRSPNIKIIVLSMMDEANYRHAALLAGADAFVQKNTLSQTLVSAIRETVGWSNDPTVTEMDVNSENETRFMRLVENAQDLVYRYDFSPVRGFTYVSSAATALTGYTPAEHYADPDLGLKLVHPDDRHLLENMEQGRDTLQSPVVLRWIRKDGSVLWSEQRNVPIYDRQGRLIAIEGIARDITAQKLAEDALRQSEDRYRDLIENLRELICTHDLEGHILSANPAAAKMLGYELKDILNMNIRDILFPDVQGFYEQYAKRIQRYGKASGTMIVRTAAGERRIWEYENTLRTDGVREPVVRGMARDITERVQTDEMLRYQAKLLASVSDAIVSTDLNFVVKSWNAGAERIFGYTEQEVLGKLAREVLKIEYVGTDREGLIASLTSTGEWQGETIIEGKGGRLVNTLVSTATLRDQAGKAIGYLAISHDITEHKRAEKALREGEKRYRSIFNGVWDAIFVESLDGRILDVNDRACEMFGYSRAEFLTKTVADLVPQGQPIMKGVSNDITLTPIETVNQRANGELFPIEISGRVQTINGDNEGVLLVIVRDITVRKQAEQTLRESEAALQKAQQVAHLGSWVWHIPDDRIEWSDEMYRLFGIDKETITGSLSEVIARAIHPDDRAAVERADQAVIQNKGSKPLEYRLIWPNGEVRNVWKEAGELILDEKGNPALLTGIVQDITERKQAEERIKRQLARLTALREIDSAITSSFDLGPSLHVLLSKTMHLLNVDAARILRINPELGTVDYAAGLGFRTNRIQSAGVKLGESYAGKAALERHIVKVPNVAGTTGALIASGIMKDEGFVSYYGAPLILKGKVIGVLEVYRRSLIEQDADWLDFFSTLAGQAAIAIENTQLFHDLQRTNSEVLLAYDATIEGWSRAMDLRDKETEGHTRRVTDMTIQLARLSDVRGEELAQIRRGCLLHDIGKMGVPDQILLKPDKLTDEEWEVMQQHPGYAYEMLSSITFLKPALDIPYCHHERWDGSGYPRGLRGEQIPFAARLFAVVDVWDALTNDRPYRPAWTEEEAYAYIREQAGKQFDPQVAELFLRLVRGGIADAFTGEPGM